MTTDKHRRSLVPPSRRAVAAAALVVLLAPAAASCGDDPNDAPGGSAPSTAPANDQTVASGVGTVTSDSRVSSEDEGHPTVPGEAGSSAPGG